jgi:hypothetical protein
MRAIPSASVLATIEVWLRLSKEKSMSHRSALAVSIALTLVLALGIFAGRDRLFETAADAGSATVSPAVSLDDAVRGSEKAKVSTAPRVIEIPLPPEQRTALRQGDGKSQQVRGDDHEGDQYDGDEYEGEDDD